jgi:hypothetical protein
LLDPAFVAVVAMCFAAGLVPAKGAQDKPSIILFIADEHDWLDSGAYADSLVMFWTPSPRKE